MNAIRSWTSAALMFSVAALLVTNTAMAQGVAVGTEKKLFDDSPEVVDSKSHPKCHAHRSQSAAATAARPGPYRRPFLIALGYVPLATYFAAAGPLRSDVLFPSKRLVMVQIVGAGDVVNPRVRLGVTAIFNEAVTGLPRDAATWQFGGAAPVVIGTFQPFIIGGGPIFGYRAGDRRQSDVGAVVLTGASIPVRKGLAVNLVAPVTALFTHRTTVSVGIAAGIANVF